MVEEECGAWVLEGTAHPPWAATPLGCQTAVCRCHDGGSPDSLLAFMGSPVSEMKLISR